MDVKDSCIFRANWLNAAHKIENPALRCCFFEAVLQYALTGMKTEAPAELNLALEVIYSLIDIDRDKYEKKIEKRREAGKKGMASRWGNHQEETPITNDSKNNKCYQEITNVTNITDTVTVTDTVTDTVKDNDFKNTPIPPKGGRALDFEDFYHRVKAVSIPKAIEEMHYERQYAWRMAEGIPGYGVEVSDAIKTKSKPYLQDYIGEINKKYQPCTPFEQLLLAMSLSKLKTKAQEAAVLEELKRSYDEPGIFRTLTDKADYIIGGGAVSSLAGFMKSRKQ